MKILIAEDDTATRKLLEADLTRWGYEVTAAGDGKSALDTLLSPAAPRLAILDWTMPGLEGPDICRRLRRMEQPDPTYVILLTGRGDTPDIIEGLGAGADDYVVKPFETDVLHARVEVGRRVVDLQNAMAENQKLQGVVQMAGAICHELNQPMQVVLGLCQLLVMDLDEENPLSDSILSISEQIDKMGHITKKLMMGIMKYETRRYMAGKADHTGQVPAPGAASAAGSKSIPHFPDSFH